MKVVIPTEYYPPAFKAGGPIRSIENIVNLLSNTVEFEIISSNRDLDGGELVSITKNTWYEKPNRIYLDENSLLKKMTMFKYIFKRNNPDDILYLNSLFTVRSTFFLLLFCKLKLLKFKRVVLAPRGQLISEALNSKSDKKQLFIKVSKFLKLYKGVTFHATSTDELESIAKTFNNEVILCQNIPSTDLLDSKIVNTKSKNVLNCCFSGRIHPHKNLLFILKSINDACNKGANITLDVYGAFEDLDYHSKCLSFIKKHRLEVRFLGAIPHHNLIEKISCYDLFLSPTLSENFGHSIAESLSLGVPVLISDRTPFRHLEQYGVGFDLSLDEPHYFVDKLIYFNELTQEELQRLKVASKRFMREKIDLEHMKSSYLNLFRVENV